MGTANVGSACSMKLVEVKIGNKTYVYMVSDILEIPPVKVHA